MPSHRAPARIMPSRRAPARTGAVLAVTVLSLGVLACRRHAPAAVIAAAPVVEPAPPLPAPLHGARLPERLDDSTFWRMINEFSEPNGYFRSENFVSNEMGLQFVIPRLLQTIRPGGVYMGVGPEQNFTYIAAFRPRIAFIVDIRRQNLLQHLWYKAVFELSNDRADFLSRLFARQRPAGLNANTSVDSMVMMIERAVPDYALFRKTFDDARTLLMQKHGFALDSSDVRQLRYVDSIFFIMGPDLNYASGSSGGGGMRGMPSFAQIAQTTDDEGNYRGFLGSDVAYQTVRDMQRRNLIVPVVGNFSGPSALRSVGRWLGERGASVSVFYVSNVEQYLFQQDDDWARFYRNVSTMPLDSTSTFIRSVTNRGRYVGGTQSTMMMNQITSPMIGLIRDVLSGQVTSYSDVLMRSSN